MNKEQFLLYIDDAIKQEMLLGSSKNECRLIGLRNIKSDFNYILSKNPKLTTNDILKSMYKERIENVQLYLEQKRDDLWKQENIEKQILVNYLPEEPSEEKVKSFLSELDFPKEKSSFKKFQDACIEKFGQKVDSQIILNFINGN